MYRSYLGIVYKATNTLNGKSYIGITTKDLEKRKSEHIEKAKRGGKLSVFHNALVSYNYDFEWEVIDFEYESTEGLLNKEKDYIKFYNTFYKAEKSMGYNMTLGGEGTFGFGKINEEQVIRIKEMIRDVDDTLVNIALELDVPVSTVRAIYQGDSWTHIDVDGFSPRMERIYKHWIPEEKIKLTKELLMENKDSYRKIGKYVGIDCVTVLRIAKGEIHNDIKVTGFSEKMHLIRENHFNQIKTIKEKLMKGFSSYQISNQMNIPLSFVRGIREKGNYKDISIPGYSEWEEANPVLRLNEQLTAEIVIKIKLELIKGQSYENIADNLEVEKDRIYKIHRGLTYSNIVVEGFEPKSVHPFWNTGSNKPNTKLTEELIPLIRVLHKRKNLTRKQIGEYFDVMPSHISSISEGKQWSHVPLEKDNLIDEQLLINIEKDIMSKCPAKKVVHKPDWVVRGIINDLITTYDTFDEIGKKFNVQRKFIYNINHKKRYSDITVEGYEESPVYRDTKKIVKRIPNNAVLDEDKVVQIREELMNNTTIKDLSKKLSINERTLTDVKNLKSWKHVLVPGYENWLNSK